MLGTSQEQVRRGGPENTLMGTRFISHRSRRCGDDGSMTNKRCGLFDLSDSVPGNKVVWGGDQREPPYYSGMITTDRMAPGWLLPSVVVFTPLLCKTFEPGQTRKCQERPWRRGNDPIPWSNHALAPIQRQGLKMYFDKGQGRAEAFSHIDGHGTYTYYSDNE